MQLDIGTQPLGLGVYTWNQFAFTGLAASSGPPAFSLIALSIAIKAVLSSGVATE
jgi:hypothetical protein